MAGKQALLRIALAVCVPITGFVIGRGVPSSSTPKPKSEAAASKPSTASRKSDLSSLLCEISTGNLSAARSRIAELRDSEVSSSELEKLLVAIARKDGASFDALIATFPEPLRSELLDGCSIALSHEPATFVRLLAESEAFSRVLSIRPDLAKEAIQYEPTLFLDLLEQDKFAWPAGTMESVLQSFQPDPGAALRLLDLCRSGQLKIADPILLTHNIEKLDDAGLAKLRSTNGVDVMGFLLDQEAKARALFASFDPSGQSWDGISQRRMLVGMADLIQRSGVPDIEWGGVPRNLQKVLPGSMVRTAVSAQGDAGARTLLDSIKKSNLPDETRNQMLGSAASALFEQQGNIRLAIDFAHAISSDAGGRNAGEDLLIKWMAFDPVSAQDFTTKIEPSPYRDRVLARVREISP